MCWFDNYERAQLTLSPNLSKSLHMKSVKLFPIGTLPTSHQASGIYNSIALCIIYKLILFEKYYLLRFIIFESVWMWPVLAVIYTTFTVSYRHYPKLTGIYCGKCCARPSERRRRTTVCLAGEAIVPSKMLQTPASSLHNVRTVALAPSHLPKRKILGL